MESFLVKLTVLLDKHIGNGKYAIGKVKDYPQAGSASIDVTLDGALLKVMKDRNTDYWIDVASPSAPSKFHALRVLLVLVLGLPVERSSVMVGHDIGAIERELEAIVAHQGLIADALGPTKWPETERRLADIGKRLMHPILRDALERAKA